MKLGIYEAKGREWRGIQKKYQLGNEFPQVAFSLPRPGKWENKFSQIPMNITIITNYWVLTFNELLISFLFIFPNSHIVELLFSIPI